MKNPEKNILYRFSITKKKIEGEQKILTRLEILTEDNWLLTSSVVLSGEYLHIAFHFYKWLNTHLFSIFKLPLKEVLLAISSFKKKDKHYDDLWIENMHCIMNLSLLVSASF